MGWLRNKENKKPPEGPEPEIVANVRGAKLLEDLIECCDGKSNPIKFFSADEILNATDSFSDSNLLSESSYFLNQTEWYSGKNKNHPNVLVKKFYRHLEEDIICRDIAVSSMVSGHKNFMKLVGCCLEFRNPVMVYDGVKKHYELYDMRSHTWKRRMKIAEDIATALAYLHTAFPRPFVYRCLRIWSILLDEDGVAKLTDFSYCVSIPQGETFVKVDKVAGTVGYIDEKYHRNLVVSEKTDVFAIGMLMLRFLMGEKMFWKCYEDDEKEGEADNEGDDDDNNSCHSEAMWEINDQRRQFSEEAYGEGDDDDDSATMLRTANPSFFRRFKFIEERRTKEIADPEMLEKMGEISEEELSQMNAFIILSLRCVGHKGQIPTMVEVAKEVKKIQRSLNTADSSSPSGETTLFNSPQDMSSTRLLSNQTTNTKALLTCIACLQLFHEMFQWVMLSWFRFLRKKQRMC